MKIIGRQIYRATYYRFDSPEQVCEYFKIPNAEWLDKVVGGQKGSIGSWTFKPDNGNPDILPYTEIDPLLKKTFRVPKKFAVNPSTFSTTREVKAKRTKEVVATGYYKEGIAICPICKKFITGNKLKHFSSCLLNLDYEVQLNGIVKVYDKRRSTDNL